MTILKQRYLLHKVFFISVFVLLLFSSCRSKIGGYDNPTGGGGQDNPTSGGGYDNSNYVIPITENKLDVSGDFYNGKQLYLIKVNTDTSTGTGGYAKAEETGSLDSSLYNYEENVNTKEFDIAKVNDKSEPVLVHIPFSPAEKPPILKSSLDKLKSKEYNQKSGGTPPTTGNSFIIDDVTYSIPTDYDHYYAGEYCNVWYCSQIHPSVAGNYSHIGSVTLKSIANKFDAIYEKETALLGSIYWKENEVLSDGYISQDIYYVAPTMNTKIDIVFYDMNYYSKSSFRGGIGGYFWAADMFCLEGEDYNFNGRLMLHLDSGFLEDSLDSGKVPYNTYSTLVHEFNHLLNFVNRQLKYGMTRNGHIDKVPHDTWFTEMLSAMAEGLFIKEIGSEKVHSLRAPEFLNSTNNGFISWKSNKNIFSDAEYDSYGSVWGFGLYLTRNFGGVNFVNRISTSSLSPKEAIVEAAKEYGGKKDITFEGLLCDWPQVIINKDNTNDKLPTFNKPSNATFKVGSKTYTYNVGAINMDTYTNNFDRVFESIKDSKDLNSSGFTISKIPMNHPQTLNFNLPTNEKVKMFVVVGNDEQVN